MPNTEILKLKPVYKSNIWGGDKIKNLLNKDVAELKNVAESWEFSTHSEGISLIAEGKFANKSLIEYFEETGWDSAGEYAEKYHRLPVIVKFVDAKQNLSIQVHPDDNFALNYENESGKNEMWYIVDCEKDAFIYLGFNRNTTKSEVEERVKSGTVEQILNKVYVKKGQSYYIPAGTVHAIGAGCLICEVQQASNLTYRLYDYGRLDNKGKPRKLHLKKALKVLKYAKTDVLSNSAKKLFKVSSSRHIAKNEYFKVISYTINSQFSITSISSEYKIMVVVDGKGTMEVGDETLKVRLGDAFYINNWQTLKITGKCVVLMIGI